MLSLYFRLSGEMKINIERFASKFALKTPLELHKELNYALDKRWGGGKVTGNLFTHIFTSELVSNLGFDVSELIRACVIVKSEHGNYELNKWFVSKDSCDLDFLCSEFSFEVPYSIENRRNF